MNFRKIKIVTRNALFEIFIKLNECNYYRNESFVIHNVVELQNASRNNEFKVCRRIEINAQERDDFKKKLKFINNCAVSSKTNSYCEIKLHVLIHLKST